MQNVTFLPPRQSAAQAFMASYLPYLQQQEAEKKQQAAFTQQTALATQKEQFDAAEGAKKAYLEQFLKAPPDQKRAMFTSASPEVKKLLYDPGLPDAGEQAGTLADQAQLAAMQKGDPQPIAGQSMNAPAGSRMGMPPQISAAGGGGDAPQSPANLGDTVPPVDAPSVRDRYNAWFAQQVRTSKAPPSKEAIEGQMTALSSDPTAFQPGDAAFVNATRIRDKQALTAEETTKVPLTQAQTQEAIAHAAEQRAAGAEHGANVGKIREETTGLHATNALKARLGAPAAAGAPAVPIEQADPIVRMLVNRKYDPAMMRRWKPEEQDAYLGAAMQYDPSLNMQDYPEQFKIKADFASGKSKNNVQSLNTAIGHTYDMWAASKKINNFDSIPLVNTLVNSAVNKARVGSGGGKPIIEYNDAATGATQELATLFKGGVGTEGEVHDWRKNVDPNMSQEQRTASIQQLAHMIGSRFEALGSNYARTGRDPSELLNAKSKTLLQRMGINPQTFEIEGAGSAPGAPPPADMGIITTPDGLKWKKNPDGSMTQVQ